MPLTDNPTVTLYWSTVFNPTSISQVNQMQSYTPVLPFFPNTIGGTNFAVSPTAVSATAAVGPAN